MCDVCVPQAKQPAVPERTLKLHRIHRTAPFPAAAVSLETAVSKDWFNILINNKTMVYKCFIRSRPSSYVKLFFNYILRTKTIQNLFYLILKTKFQQQVLDMQ